MKPRLLPNRKTMLNPAPAFLILLILRLIPYLPVIVSTGHARWRGSTQTFLENLQKSPMRVEILESSYRGSVLPGKESFSEASRTSLSAAEQEEAVFGESPR